MYRQHRNTQQWFLKEGPLGEAVGPGAYLSSNQKQGSKSISFNFGQIPFGSGDSRFKPTGGYYYYPGPGDYHQTEIAEGIEELKVSRMQTQSNQRDKFKLTSSFKSAQPRIALYQQFEKNYRTLHGQNSKSKSRPEYLTQINNEVVDLEGQHSRVAGSVKKGVTFIKRSYKSEQGKKRTGSTSGEKERDLFGVGKASKIGPGHYQVQDDLVHRKNASITIQKTGRNQSKTVKHQMEEYLQKILQEKSEEKDKDKQDDEPKPLVFGPPHKNSVFFLSKTKRHDLVMNGDNPGPGEYLKQKEQAKQVRKIRHSIQKFGSNQKRDYILQRDIQRSPYQDPSKSCYTGPIQYQSDDKAKQDLLRSTLSGQKPPEVACPFNSTLKRDYMEQVVKTLGQSPGPGQYENDMQLKLKEVDEQISMRYQIRPFGSNQPRFTYQSQKANDLDLALEQYPTFYDEDQLRKKILIDKAIDKVKEMERVKGNAVFKSATKRFSSQAGQSHTHSHFSTMHTIENYSRNVPDVYDGKDGSKKNIKTIFASTLTTQLEGAINSRIKATAFNTQSPRFQTQESSLSKQKFETPGPGQYYLSRSIGKRMFSGGGGGNNDVLLKGASRESNSFLPKFSEQDAAVGPGSYLKTTPFVKKSFNATLPPRRFY